MGHDNVIGYLLHDVAIDGKRSESTIVEMSIIRQHA